VSPFAAVRSKRDHRHPVDSIDDDLAVLEEPGSSPKRRRMGRPLGLAYSGRQELEGALGGLSAAGRFRPEERQPLAVG
jgi:hypothetical protein